MSIMEQLSILMSIDKEFALLVTDLEEQTHLQSRLVLDARVEA